MSAAYEGFVFLSVSQGLEKVRLVIRDSASDVRDAESSVHIAAVFRV